jgi:ATP-dependent Clp protease ATP-binding subunit ClpA
MSQINRELQLTLQAAMREAMARRHAYLTVEHLLLALVHDQRGAEVLRHSGVNLGRLQSELERFLKEDLDAEPEGEPVETAQTLAFHRVIQAALAHADNAEREEVEAGDLVAALFQEPESHAMELLRAQGVTRLDVLKYVSHGISRLPDPEARRQMPGEPGGGGRPAGMEEEDEEIDDPLSAFSVELCERAREGKLDPLVGRQNELERAVHVLARRRKNNPIFVGESGVGKTALAEGLAQRIVAGEVPGDLENAEIFAVDLGSMLAGTKYRGDFEARFKAFVQAVQARPNPVVFIDEIHTVLGAGAAQGATVDASNMLKPLLQSGELRCIGSTTYQEYRHFEKDRALARRFQKIEVHEPSNDESLKILKGLAPRYEEHHGVRYTVPALRACVELSAKHLADRFLPDKAIDVMDEVGAAVRLRSKDKRKTVGVADVERLVSQMAKVPIESASTSDRERLEQLQEDLLGAVYGQDEAVETVVRAVKRGRAGLGGSQKPIGSFLFIGPTGVGKTELAKQLAATMGVEFLRFDMSEYRAAGLRRLRGRGTSGGVDPPHPARGSAARRDREGPPGSLRHPAADHGSRDPDRQPRARGRLPPRRPDHDLERGRPRHGRARDRLWRGVTRRRQEGAGAAVQPRVPQPSRRDRALLPAHARCDAPRGRQVRGRARGTAR